MRRLILIFLVLALTVAPVYGDELQEGLNAFDRQDYKTALEVAKPLAEQGFPEAQYRLGQFYFLGRGVRRDEQEAVKWLRLAAEQEHAGAQYSLGVAYAAGRGVRQNDQESAIWLFLAAEQGHAQAQYSLGVIWGVRQDNVLAYKWFYIAGTNGIEKAIRNRNIIEKQMTKEQIAEAQKLAREWLKKHQKN